MQTDHPVKGCWQLQGSKAKAACGDMLAEVDVQRPTRGLNNLRLLNEVVGGWLMAVNFADPDSAPQQEKPWQPVDVYARGGDLVATYREPLGQPFQLQIYWRVLPTQGGEASSLEAILSIQTREWEAYPAITLSSALDVSGAEVHAGGVKFLSRHDWSYVEASPAGDFEPTIVTPTSGLIQANWQYDKRFMERGVIRRLRLRGAIVPLVSAEDAIEQFHRRFATDPPPLTA